jgi:cystathionine beta-lyase
VPDVDLDALTPDLLRARRSLKWNLYPEGVLPLWVAEMDFPTAPPVQQAIERAVRAESYGYPLPAKPSGLAEATAEHLESAHGWAVDPNGVHLVADVMRGVALAIEYLTGPDDAVVIPTPVYMPFFDVIELTGRPQVHVPMAGRSLDVPAIDRALARGARTVILCNPHNPLGRVFTRAELLALAEVVHRHGARVIADEIHAPLVFDGVHVPYAGLCTTTAGHTVTVTSASKAWNIPGLKCAQVVTSNVDDARAWAAIPIWATVGVSTLGIAANLAAYREGGEWLVQVRERLERNAHLVAEAVAGMPGVRHERNQGTYLAWLDCTGLGLDREPADWFLEHARVALSPGLPFRAPPNRFARLNFATTADLLEQALERLGTACATRWG